MNKPFTPLTRREVEILHYLVTGLTNAEIADRCGVKVSTATTHTTNLYRKMRVRSRAEAVAQHKGAVSHPMPQPNDHHTGTSGANFNWAPGFAGMPPSRTTRRRLRR